MSITGISKYSRGAIVLHWLIGLLIIANIAGAMLTEGLPRETRMSAMALHKAFGMVILVLAIVRIGWRLTHKPPTKPAALAVWEIWLSRVVHFIFYALMILLPLSGWVWMSANGKPINMFGLFDLPLLPVGQSKELADIMHDRHEVLGLSMLALLVLHILGALKHQFLDHMPFIQRMWP